MRRQRVEATNERVRLRNSLKRLLRTKKLLAALTRSFSFDDRKLFLLPLADLIADGATCLARRLTRGLAFAATALLERGLKRRLVDGLDVFHVISSFLVASG